jgi:hypothetical protein
LGYPLKGDCLDTYLFEGILECWSSGVLKKQLTNPWKCIVPRKEMFFLISAIAAI